MRKFECWMKNKWVEILFENYTPGMKGRMIEDDKVSTFKVVEHKGETVIALDLTIIKIKDQAISLIGS